ncbi:MAG: UDP-N-acetylmuramoyl-L-alanyl-D-glutamate--2,6-diaminopimelate ligase, partial [Bacteroidales bacterium]|nr:UDP-N-acetylmuramoyl-L-alanyl-D-glutamate--2,6-diaminopimelate ligase [Candidatus Sodaliphilus fimicaballi]
MKQLDTLIYNINPLRVEGDATVAITDVVCDSRLVKPGTLFIAVKGVAVDAHKFIPQVIE